jgi:hypothetical protein
LEREQEERRRSKLFRDEIEWFRKNLDERLYQRKDQAIAEAEATQDFADAVQILEETERLKQEQAEREKQRLREEEERKQYEEQVIAERARREEEERLEKIRLEQEAEAERVRMEQRERDTIAVASYMQVLVDFRSTRDKRLQMRVNESEKKKREQETREAERRKRQQGRQAAAK